MVSQESLDNTVNDNIDGKKEGLNTVEVIRSFYKSYSDNVELTLNKYLNHRGRNDLEYQSYIIDLMDGLEKYYTEIRSKSGNGAFTDPESSSYIRVIPGTAQVHNLIGEMKRDSTSQLAYVNAEELQHFMDGISSVIAFLEPLNKS